MSELRKDPIYGHDVIVAPDRMSRPNAIVCQPPEPDDPTDCPFCVGNEAMTPQPALALPPGDEPWQVRVVPNRYPVLTSKHGTGAHEVVIESPDHEFGFLALEREHRRLVFTAYRDRFRHYASAGNFHYGLLFKNQGRHSGASLSHVHSQFVALHEPMEALRRALNSSRRFFAAHQRCIFCELIDVSADDDLHIDATGDFIALCPAAGRCPYEIWILPAHHASRLEAVPDELLGRLADFASSTLARLENTIQHVAYNFAIHSAPFDTNFDDHYHWHMVISPRISGIAGFEMSTNVFINPVDPNAAAAQLRDA